MARLASETQLPQHIYKCTHIHLIEELSQEEPGGDGRSQEKPGARRSQEEPGGVRTAPATPAGRFAGFGDLREGLPGVTPEPICATPVDICQLGLSRGIWGCLKLYSIIWGLFEHA